MKFLKRIFIILVIVVGLGYGVYHFGTSFIASKVSDVLAEELDNEETLESIKTAINNNPEIKQLIADGATVNENNLPFKTKEEAVDKVIKKIGINELNTIKNNYENGMTMSEVQQLMEQIESKLTDEEILALKAIAYKELYK